MKGSRTSRTARSTSIIHVCTLRDLIEDASGEVQSFRCPSSTITALTAANRGRGNQSPTIHLSAMPAGQYSTTRGAMGEVAAAGDPQRPD
jgi:hypothetical protein